MHTTKRVFAGLMSVLALTCGARASLVVIDGNTVNATTVTSAVHRLSGTHNWTADNQYLLHGVILIGNGAVLNIEAGTVIRGANEITTGVHFRPGTLIVERGGRIYANGTATRPIIMTDEWDNHNPWGGQTGTSVTRTWRYRNADGVPFNRTETYNYGAVGNHRGAWGGLVLCGRAFLNADGGGGPATLGAHTLAVEGLAVELGVVGGGRDDDDSSGRLSYVQIRYGGSQLVSASEINGLTMYGVGRGTEISHIEVLNNQDDMFEWFGGTVNSKYLVAWGTGDDTFDIEAGFRGKSQFLFGTHRDMGGQRVESGASDKGMEIDGYERHVAGGLAAGSTLFSAPLFANITLVGNQYPEQGRRHVPISMRDNASPQIYNSVFMDFGSVATLIENRHDRVTNGVILSVTERFLSSNAHTNMPQWTTTNAFGVAVGPAYLYQAQVPGNQACIRGSVFWNIPDGLHPTQVGGDAMREAGYTSILPDHRGPWAGTNLTMYSGWTLSNEGNVTDIYGMSAGNDVTADAINLMPIARRRRVATSGLVTAGFHITEIDPRAANDAATGAMFVPCGWMTPTAYRGAFSPDSNWAQGWTTIATFGLFGPYTAAPPLDALNFNGLTPVTGVFTPRAGTEVSALALSSVLTFQGAMGRVYQLQSTDSLAGTPVWSAVKTFRVDIPGTKSVVDVLGAAPAAGKFYRVVEGSVL